jgi:hypothetical protein
MDKLLRRETILEVGDLVTVQFMHKTTNIEYYRQNWIGCSGRITSIYSSKVLPPYIVTLESHDTPKVMTFKEDELQQF